MTKSMRLQIAKSLNISAFALAILANIVPFMNLYSFGEVEKITIIQTVTDFIDSGSWLLGSIVFVASILIPFIKIFTIFYLLSNLEIRSLPKKNRIHSFIEYIGKWSMLDVFLLAIIISITKKNHSVEITAEPGAIYFLMVVIFSILASQLISKKDFTNG
ncbi:MAG: paraquat-inducible protein A [Oligoflexia bacterium]|nr:paraquat-inducible protein A [Oligoflexia bacterium]